MACKEGQFDVVEQIKNNQCFKAISVNLNFAIQHLLTNKKFQILSDLLRGNFLWF